MTYLNTMRTHVQQLYSWILFRILASTSLELIAFSHKQKSCTFLPSSTITNVSYYSLSDYFNCILGPTPSTSSPNPTSGPNPGGPAETKTLTISQTWSQEPNGYQR